MVEKAPKKLQEKVIKQENEERNVVPPKSTKTRRRIVIESDEDDVFDAPKVEETKSEVKVEKEMEEKPKAKATKKVKEAKKAKEAAKEIKTSKETKETKETKTSKAPRAKKSKDTDYELVVEAKDEKTEKVVVTEEEPKKKKASSGAYRGKWQTAQRDPPKHGQKAIPKGKPDCLSGLAFVLTGLNESLTRDELSTLIKEHGGYGDERFFFENDDNN